MRAYSLCFYCAILLTGCAGCTNNAPASDMLDAATIDTFFSDLVPVVLAIDTVAEEMQGLDTIASETLIQKREELEECIRISPFKGKTCEELLLLLDEALEASIRRGNNELIDKIPTNDCVLLRCKTGTMRARFEALNDKYAD